MIEKVFQFKENLLHKPNHEEKSVIKMFSQTTEPLEEGSQGVIRNINLMLPLKTRYFTKQLVFDFQDRLIDLKLIHDM